MNAVIIPRAPPPFPRLALSMNLAAAKTMNVTASAVRRDAKARFLNITAGISIAVNMNQVARYNPTAFDNSCVLVPYAAMIPDPGMKMAAYDIQKQPKEEKAVAPKTLPLGNSHIPAMNCKRPPTKMAIPTTIFGTITPWVLMLIKDSRNVVAAKENKPTGAGLAILDTYGALCSLSDDSIFPSCGDSVPVCSDIVTVFERGFV